MCSNTGYLIQADPCELHRILAMSRSINSLEERYDYLHQECESLKKRYNISESYKVSIYDMTEDNDLICLFVMPTVTLDKQLTLPRRLM